MSSNLEPKWKAQVAIASLYEWDPKTDSSLLQSHFNQSRKLAVEIGKVFWKI